MAMSGVEVPKRIHIVPLGYEKDRIVDPVLQLEADEVLFLRPDPSKEGVDQPAYLDDARRAISDAGVETETIECDIFNLYDSLGAIAELANEFREHNIYVNLASGSKVTAIGGMIACMATGASPYYVRADEYAGGDERPVASGVESIEQLPRYHIDEPEAQHIAVLEYIKQRSQVKKGDLIALGKRRELPFISRYDAQDVQNPDRGYYRRLNSQIIDPLDSQNYIEVEKHSKYQYVSLTESGKNRLQAFRYLLNNEGTTEA
jgi:Ni/Co efflux regulator RcnB